MVTSNVKITKQNVEITALWAPQTYVSNFYLYVSSKHHVANVGSKSATATVKVTTTINRVRSTREWRGTHLYTIYA